MKRFAGVILCLILVLSMAGCAQVENEAETQGISAEQTEAVCEVAASEQAENTDYEVSDESSEPVEVKVETEVESSAEDGFSAEESQSSEPETEEKELKLYFNDTEVPVTWENNAAVLELSEEAAKGDITVSMSMYGGWEQVGSLGRSYTRNDSQMTTMNGDIVLYSGNQIVVFYGSNFWAYTKLGKMNLSESEVTELLSNGDITLTIGY